MDSTGYKKRCDFKMIEKDMKKRDERDERD